MAPPPGLVFRPTEHIKLGREIYLPDLHRLSNWVKVGDNSSSFQAQKSIDASSGFDFVAYHRSAQNRRYELRFEDVQILCKDDNKLSISCFVLNREHEGLNRSKAYRHCACIYAKKFS